MQQTDSSLPNKENCSWKFTEILIFLEKHCPICSLCSKTEPMFLVK